MPPYEEERERSIQEFQHYQKTVAEITDDLMVTKYGYKFEDEQATAAPEYDQLITVDDRYFLMSLNIDID